MDPELLAEASCFPLTVVVVLTGVGKVEEHMVQLEELPVRKVPVEELRIARGWVRLVEEVEGLLQVEPVHEQEEARIEQDRRVAACPEEDPTGREAARRELEASHAAGVEIAFCSEVEVVGVDWRFLDEVGEGLLGFDDPG